MDELSRLPLSPFSYRQDTQGNQIVARENRLRDVVGEYLYSAALWLIGYEAGFPVIGQRNKKPIRVQAVGTPWLVALTVDYLADTWLLLHKDFPELSSELDVKLLSAELDKNEKGAVWWLLEPRFQNWEIKSDQLLYDVSVTLLALLKVAYVGKQFSPPNWSKELEQRIWVSIASASKWLEKKLDDESFITHDLAQSGGQHLGRAFELLAFFSDKFPKEFSKTFARENSLFKQVIEIALRFAESKITQNENAQSSAITTIQREFFYGLACLVLATEKGNFLAKINFDSKKHIVIKVLEVYTNWYESAVSDRSAGGFLSSVRNLAIYVKVDEALSILVSNRKDDFLPERIVRQC